MMTDIKWFIDSIYRQMLQSDVHNMEITIWLGSAFPIVFFFEFVKPFCRQGHQLSRNTIHNLPGFGYINPGIVVSVEIRLISNPSFGVEIVEKSPILINPHEIHGRNYPYEKAFSSFCFSKKVYFCTFCFCTFCAQNGQIFHFHPEKMQQNWNPL